VLYVVADRLAVPEDQWWPFDRAGARKLLYPDPDRQDDAFIEALRTQPAVA
jgi:hypothetical protein